MWRQEPVTGCLLPWIQCLLHHCILHNPGSQSPASATFHEWMKDLIVSVIPVHAAIGALDLDPDRCQDQWEKPAHKGTVMKASSTCVCRAVKAHVAKQPVIDLEWTDTQQVRIKAYDTWTQNLPARYVTGFLSPWNYKQISLLISAWFIYTTTVGCLINACLLCVPLWYFLYLHLAGVVKPLLKMWFVNLTFIAKGNSLPPRSKFVWKTVLSCGLKSPRPQWLTTCLVRARRLNLPGQSDQGHQVFITPAQWGSG